MWRMAKYITYLIIIAFLTMWGMQTQGKVHIEWLGHELKMYIGLFFLLLVVYGIVFHYLFNTWQYLSKIPAYLQNYFSRKKIEHARADLLTSIIKLFERDYREALENASKAGRGLKNTPVPQVIKAKALEHIDLIEAERTYDGLLKNKSTLALAYQGKIRLALKQEDYNKALHLAEEGLDHIPNNADIARYLCEINIRLGLFSEALHIAEAFYKKSPYFSAGPNNPLVLIYFGLGQNAEQSDYIDTALEYYQKANKVNPTFIPAAEALARLYIKGKYHSKAHKVLKVCWQELPHPQIGELFLQTEYNATSTRQYELALELIEMKPHSAYAQYLAARKALKADLLKKAKTHFDLANELSQEMPPEMLALKADLEEAEKGSNVNYKDKFSAALKLKPAPQWVCGHCGHESVIWQFSCTECNQLNSYKPAGAN